MDRDIKQARAEIAQIIRDRGWSQGACMQKDGSVCVVGAINMWLTGNPYRIGRTTPEKIAIIRRLYSELGREVRINLAHWNDAPGRTVQQVLDLLNPPPTT